jgi:hypothetical protein
MGEAGLLFVEQHDEQLSEVCQGPSISIAGELDVADKLKERPPWVQVVEVTRKLR